MPQQIPLSCTKTSGTVLLPARSWKKAQRGYLLHACLSLLFPTGDTWRWRKAGAAGQPSGRTAVGWSSGACCQGHAYRGLASGESVLSCATPRVNVGVRQHRAYTRQMNRHSITLCIRIHFPQLLLWRYALCSVVLSVTAAGPPDHLLLSHQHFESRVLKMLSGITHCLLKFHDYSNK